MKLLTKKKGNKMYWI